MTTQAQRLHLAERKAKKPSLYDEEKGKAVYSAQLRKAYEPYIRMANENLEPGEKPFTFESYYQMLKDQKKAREEREAAAKAEKEAERARRAEESERQQAKERAAEAEARSPAGKARLQKLREEEERKRLEEAERTAKPSGHDSLPKKVIDGYTYRYDRDTNLLYDYRDVMGEKRLGVVGRFRPGDEDEPVRLFDLDNLGQELLNN